MTDHVDPESEQAIPNIPTAEAPESLQNVTESSMQQQGRTFVTGDRICAMCGFNLYGQPVMRESHYNMLAIRCPECGTMAAIQEYPIYSKWGARWGRLIAAVWLLAVLFWFVITVWVTAQHAYWNAYTSVIPTTRAIASTFGEYYMANRDQFSQWSEWYDQWYDPESRESRDLDSAIVDTQWWENTADQQAIVQSLGSWSARYNWYSTRALVYNIIPLFLLGSVWAVLVPGKRSLLALVTVILIALAALVLSRYAYVPIIWLFLPWTNMYYMYTNTWGTFIDAHRIALETVGLPIRIMASAVLAVPLFFGMLYGRIVARAVVVALLPPKSRGWLAFLWTDDGKEPPRKTWIDR